MVKKIAITTSSFGKYDNMPLSLLKEKGFEIVTNNFGRKLDRKETLEFCKGCVGIIAGTEVYDSEILGGLDGLRTISRCGAGLESVDINTAGRLGIKIFNTPDAPTLAVAELTAGLILSLLRKTNITDTEVKSGQWKKIMGNLLSGKEVGIIGFGRIGKKVAELLKPFGCKIYYTDPVIKNMPGFLPFRELISRADIVSLHVSGGNTILGEKELRLMKEGAWLVNVSRGGVVDEKALYSALKEGYLAGAALDVFEQEPYKGPLTGLDNVILTPHIGSYAKETRVKMETEAAKNLLKGLGVLE